MKIRYQSGLEYQPMCIGLVLNINFVLSFKAVFVVEYDFFSPFPLINFFFWPDQHQVLGSPIKLCLRCFYYLFFIRLVFVFNSGYINLMVFVMCLATDG